MINEVLKNYISTAILPQYDNFDKGHNRRHIDHVIAESLTLAQAYDVDKNMAYTIAAYHDIGIPRGRKEHHLFSGEILAADRHLRQWFTEEQITIMREAIEDHRASSKNSPRTIYGCIVAEADREISVEITLKRTLQFGLNNYPDESFEFHLQRAIKHLNDKYAEGGYLKLYLHSEANERGLAELRTLIADKEKLMERLKILFENELNQRSF